MVYIQGNLAEGNDYAQFQPGILFSGNKQAILIKKRNGILVHILILSGGDYYGKYKT